jgi:hypothetical protein
MIADNPTAEMVDQSHGPHSGLATGVHWPGHKPTPNSYRCKMGRMAMTHNAG